MFRIHVKYFASVREAIGCASEDIHTLSPTLAALRDELAQRSSAHAQALSRARTLRVALNHHICDEQTPLADGAEVAFFPPVTGG